MDGASSQPSTACSTASSSGSHGTTEPDCSSASYFLAAGALLPETRLNVAAWPESDWQIDGHFVEFLQRFKGKGTTYPAVSRTHDLGDAIMTAIAVAPFLPQPSRFIDLGRLRIQESERVYALRTELTRCGGRVTETGDTLDISPSELHGAEIAEYANGNIANHDPTRPRKLLLHKREIDTLIGKTRERGLTLVPTRLYFKDGRVKIELALARGKEKGDKRADVKERDARREIDRALKTRR